jgi:hypothetical protein
MLDFDDYSGVGSMSLLDATTDTSFVLVAKGRYSGSAGPVHLVSNSVNTDADGDGVGLDLELALTSCDSASTFPRCAQAFNFADSDRDGISDYAEVFGVNGATPLRLHRWGARPGVKDVFVEVDWSDQSAANPDGFADNPLSPVHSTPVQIETFARAIQEYYVGSGISDWLGNIATSDRVRIHLDLGLDPPVGSADVWLYGDWGGSSGCASNTDSGFAYNNCLSPNRKGFFRVALAANEGGGQSPPHSPHLWWGVRVPGEQVNLDPEGLAHELGHAVGALQHWGSNFYGGAWVNGSPLYVSIMNYAFLGLGSGIKFSYGTNAGYALNPAAAPENPSFALPAQLASGSYDFEMAAAGGGLSTIDWNRDGLFGNLVRAGISFNERADQSLANQTSTITFGGSTTITPALTVGPGNRHYVFFVASDGTVRYHSAPHAGLVDGGCPGDDVHRDGIPCTIFSQEFGIPTPSNVTQISATFFQGNLALAYVDVNGHLRVTQANTVTSLGELMNWSAAQLIASGVAQARPALSVWNVDPGAFSTSQVLGVIYPSQQYGTYDTAHRVVAGNSWTAPVPLVTSTFTTVSRRGYGAAATPWPSASPPQSVQGSVCVALSVGGINWAWGDVAEVRIYCLNRSTGLWTLLPLDSPPAWASTFAPPGLTFHVARRSNGAATDSSSQRGSFWLSYLPNPTEGPKIAILAATGTNLATPTLSGTWKRVASGWWGNRWSDTATGIGVDLRSDLSVGAMKGVWVRVNSETNTRAVRFEPTADGTFDGELCDGNDWLMMNRATCQGLRATPVWQDSDVFCGTFADFEDQNFGSQLRTTCAP